MVNTRRRGLDQSAQGATFAIQAGGNRALRRYLGVSRAPKLAPRPKPAPVATCGAERERIRVLERVVAQLQAGRATAVRRALNRAAPREQARQMNMYSSPGFGMKHWENMGPAWASLKYAQEMAVSEKPRGTPFKRSLPPLPRFTR